MQLDCDDNVYMYYFAHENNVINDYLGLLRKAFREHKPNECLLSSTEFIDRVAVDDELMTEECESLEAAHNFIKLRIEVVSKEKSENAARNVTKNTTKKDVGKMIAKRAARSVTNC